MFTEQERHDIKAVGETLGLVSQVLTYTMPENWRFNAQFPERFRCFRLAAGRLARSKDRKLKEYGRALIEFDVCLTELDRGFTQAKAARAARLGKRVVDTMQEAKAHVV
ncbi:hypothetical protein MKY59_25775 [Paenibacillus sp. FSL W8-0426]|uniref:hypothetical protein n=1 Tax=Paenibacillus sp. FSL W8-0426 TaxID=2921714 RepID=UPI0030DBF2DF